MNLFKNEDILEKKYRLKYKYLIEIEPLIIEILEDDSFDEYIKDPSNSTLTKLFNTIFNSIINSAKPYFSYLDIKYYTSYDIPYSLSSQKLYEDTKYKCELNMFYEILKNHCIINGFISSLHSSIDNTKALRGMYDYYNKQPESIKAKYKHSLTFFQKQLKPKSTLSSDKTKSQEYNKAYSDLKGTYINTILNNNYVSIDNDNFITLNSNFSELYISLFFSNQEIRSTIKKILSKQCSKEKFNEYYNSIISFCNNTLQGYDTPSDMLLFRAFIELFFGFDNFSYLLSNSNTTYQPFIDNEVLTTELFNIINECPAPFLKNYLVYIVIANKPNIDSLKHFIYSFRCINTLTIPIFEDLWNVTIHELFDLYTNNTTEYKLPHISDMYKSYINTNYLKLVEPPISLLTKLNRLEYEINTVANSINELYTVFKDITSYLNKIHPENILNVDFITPNDILDTYKKIHHDKNIILTENTLTKFREDKLSRKIEQKFNDLTYALFSLFNINTLDNSSELLSSIITRIETKTFAKDHSNLHLLANLFASEASIKHNDIFYYIYNIYNFDDTSLANIQELFNTSNVSALNIKTNRPYTDGFSHEIRNYKTFLQKRKESTSFKNINDITLENLSLDSLESFLPTNDKLDSLTKTAKSSEKNITKTLKEIKGILKSAEELYNRNNISPTNYKVNPKDKSIQHAQNIDDISKKITSSISNVKTLIAEINTNLKELCYNSDLEYLKNYNQLSTINFDSLKKRNFNFAEIYLSEYNTNRIKHFDNINTLPMFNNSHIDYYIDTLYKRQRHTHNYQHLLANYYLN